MDHPWIGSYLPLDNIAWAKAPVQSIPDMVTVYFLMILALCVLIMYERVVVAISSSVTIFRSKMRMKEVLRDKYRVGSIDYVLALAIPYYSLVFTSTGISHHKFWINFLILLSFFAARFVLIKMVAWLTGKKEELSNVYRLSQAVFLLIMVLSLLLPLFMKIIPSVPNIIVVSYLVAITSVLLLIYYVNARTIFLGSGFSLFFWILYLCALEILPICVAVNAIAF